MPKPKPYSRREFRRRLVKWLRNNLLLVVLFTLGLIGLLAVLTTLILLTFPGTSFRAWMLGALQVALVATYLHLLHTAFLAHDASAIWQLRGAWGEDNTRDELHRAKRKKLIWDWLDSINLPQGDIDHLIITRQGGLVAVDSKWRGVVTDATEMARDAQKVRLRAEALTRDMLKGDTRGSRRARANPLRVTAVVVLWGAAQRDVPEGAAVDGIEFVPGRRLVEWLARLSGQPVDKTAAAQLARDLEGRRRALGSSHA